MTKAPIATLMLMLTTALSACEALPPASANPSLVVEQRGDPSLAPRDRGRLLSMQAWLEGADSVDEARFHDRLHDLFLAAAARGLIDARTIVVLPEYLGTWLVVADEGADVASAATITDALTKMAIYKPAFLPTSWSADVDDGDAFAIFTLKSARMRDIYQRVIGGLAREFDVTVVGGSIVLPTPQLVDGALVTVEGAPLQNVSVVFDRTGHATAIARKRFPTADEVGFVSRADLDDSVAVVDTEIGRLGVVVCADAWFPEIYAQLAARRATLLAVPTFHSGGDDVWHAPWGGYSAHDAPDDVDGADIGTLTEATAWEKYALAGRAPDAGIVAAVSAPLRGTLWDTGDTGQAFLVDAALPNGFERMPEHDGPGLFSLTFNAASTSSSSTSSSEP